MAEVKSGYMHKCGKSVKSWKKRWFILKPNGYLYYYETPSSKSEKGKIDVIDAMKIAPWQEVGTAEKKIPSGMSSENAFAIVASDRTYTCVCEQDGESSSWMAAIEKVRGAANGGEQQYPPPTYTEKAQVKNDDQLMSSPPPYAPSCPPPSQADSLPRKQPPPMNAGLPPTKPPPVMTMPSPMNYGGTMPIGNTQQAPPQMPSPQPTPPRPNPSAGPGYAGAYPVGSFPNQPPRNPPPPQAYRQPPPPRPQYYQQQPPRPAYQSYPQRPPPQQYYRPPPQQQYYRPPPPQQYYRPPPAPIVQQQTTTNVTVVTIPAVQQKRIVYR